jgi:hypothetical protein
MNRSQRNHICLVESTSACHSKIEARPSRADAKPQVNSHHRRIKPKFISPDNLKSDWNQLYSETSGKGGVCSTGGILELMLHRAVLPVVHCERAVVGFDGIQFADPCPHINASADSVFIWWSKLRNNARISGDSEKAH